MWFSGWTDVWGIALMAGLVFGVVLAGVRLVGNRALSRMNASDFVVTVAIGSMMATTILSRDVSLTAGATAILTLLALQALTVYASVRAPQARRAVKGNPIVLLRDGRLLRDRMLHSQVSEAEVRQAVREKGYGGFEQIEVVVLEADGQFSVVPRSEAGERDALP